MSRWISIAVAAALVALVAAAPGANAAFPGENGKLVFRDGGFNASNLFTVEPGGASLTPLGSGQGPAWSPDGSRIAFASGQISVMNADGTGRTTLTTGSGSDPAWSPDGSSIVFARYDDVSECLSLRALFRMDASGEASGVTQLTSLYEDAHLPRWSPDGSKIAFIRQVWSDASDPPLYCDVFAYPPELMVMNADGTGVQKIGQGSIYDFDWAPDGSKIVYALTFNELWTIRPDGTDETQLTATSSGPASSEAHPVWSPDGTKIAFESGSHLYVMNADATGVADLVDTSDILTVPDWQPLNRAPACDGITAHPAELHPANRRLRRVTVSGATDPDGDPVTIEITGVTQDEPVTGRSDRTAPDARTRPDAATLLLRAERDPSEDGRVYRLAVRGSDDRGGSCDAEVTVAVRRHKHSPAIDSAPLSFDSFLVP